jgi:hypothetical protein
MNEQQKLIDQQISNNDFSYWDSIKKSPKPHDGVDQNKVGIKSPEYLLWYRFKSYCQSNNIEFNIDVEDIVIPQVCEITGIPISTSFNDNRKLNYYTLHLINQNYG